MPHAHPPAATTTGSSTNRRALLRTAAWAVPTATVVTSAPAIAVSRCTPIANTLAQSFSSVTRPAGGWTAYGAYDGRVDFPESTAAVRSTVIYRNSGAEALPAGVVTARIGLHSSPGLSAEGTATPYAGISLPDPLPAGWTLEDTSVEQESSVGDYNKLRVYYFYLRYTLELPAGASAPGLALTADFTNPRPAAADYGSNLNESVPATIYGSRFSAVGRVDSCDPATGAPTVESNSSASSQYWGVWITRPGRSARTAGEQEGIQSVDPELTED